MVIPHPRAGAVEAGRTWGACWRCRASAHAFGGADDAFFFHLLNQTRGFVEADAEAALEHGDRDGAMFLDNRQGLLQHRIVRVVVGIAGAIGGDVHPFGVVLRDRGFLPPMANHALNVAVVHPGALHAHRLGGIGGLEKHVALASSRSAPGMSRMTRLSICDVTMKAMRAGKLA